MSDGLMPPVIAQLFASTGQYNAKMDEATGKMEAFGKTSDTVGTRVAGMWNHVANYALGGAVAIGAISAKMAYDYNEALDSMFRQTTLNAAQQKYLKGAILDVSTATATSATDIVSGVQQLLKAGEGEKKALHDVAEAAKYTRAQGGNLNDTLTAALGIQKQHISGTKSLTQTLDIFTTAEKHSQLTADDLSSALGGRALSAFAAYHIDLKSAVAILAGFADQNLKGSRSTLVLKTGIAALEKPAVSSTGKLTTQAKALQLVGLNMTTLADEIRKPGGALLVMQQLSNAFNENATAAMKAQGIGAWLQQIFGTSAGPAFTNIINELPKVKKLYDSLNTSGGATNSSFAQWLKSPQGAFEQFKTTLENSAIKLGDVVLPKLTVGLIEATKLITGIAGNKTASGILEGAGIAVLGGAIATKLVQGILAAGSGLGVASLEGAGAVELAGTAAGAGAVTATGIAAFLATTEVLKHNLFGLGNAVNDVTGWITHGTHNGTTNYAGNLAKALAKAGITSNATVSLSKASLDYLLGIKNDQGGHHSKKPVVTVHHKTTVRLTR